GGLAAHADAADADGDDHADQDHGQHDLDQREPLRGRGRAPVATRGPRTAPGGLAVPWRPRAHRHSPATRPRSLRAPDHSASSSEISPVSQVTLTIHSRVPELTRTRPPVELPSGKK